MMKKAIPCLCLLPVLMLLSACWETQDHDRIITNYSGKITISVGMDKPAIPEYAQVVIARREVPIQETIDDIVLRDQQKYQKQLDLINARFQTLPQQEKVKASSVRAKLKKQLEVSKRIQDFLESRKDTGLTLKEMMAHLNIKPGQAFASSSQWEEVLIKSSEDSIVIEEDGTFSFVDLPLEPDQSYYLFVYAKSGGKAYYWFQSFTVKGNGIESFELGQDDAVYIGPIKE